MNTKFGMSGTRLDNSSHTLTPRTNVELAASSALPVLPHGGGRVLVRVDADLASMLPQGLRRL